MLLPDDHGIIFARGYYLQSGEFKEFDTQLSDMRFYKRIASPNGEDFLFAFYNRESGDYVLLSYNRIARTVETPIVCGGFSLFENGEMAVFRSAIRAAEASRHPGLADAVRRRIVAAGDPADFLSLQDRQPGARRRDGRVPGSADAGRQGR